MYVPVECMQHRAPCASALGLTLRSREAGARKPFFDKYLRFPVSVDQREYYGNRASVVLFVIFLVGCSGLPLGRMLQRTAPRRSRIQTLRVASVGDGDHKHIGVAYRNPTPPFPPVALRKELIHLEVITVELRLDGRCTVARPGGTHRTLGAPEPLAFAAAATTRRTTCRTVGRRSLTSAPSCSCEHASAPHLLVLPASQWSNCQEDISPSSPRSVRPSPTTTNAKNEERRSRLGDVLPLSGQDPPVFTVFTRLA